LTTFGRRVSSDGEEGEKDEMSKNLSLSFIYPSASLISLAALIFPQETSALVKATLQWDLGASLPPARHLTLGKPLPLFQQPPGLTEHGGRHHWPQEKRRSMAHLTPAVRAGMP